MIYEIKFKSIGKMNIINLLLLAITNGFNLINGIIPYQKKYYISSKINNIHKLWIRDAMEILDLETQEFYSNECIRIYYSDLRYTGFSDFDGYLLGTNEWVIEKIAIGVNPNIEFYNAFVLIMLHEFLHSIGCMHSDVFGSIMNTSIYVINEIVQDTEYPMLHQDDIACINFLN